mmetsp:Transcript_3264/g.10175  ORF Transcript_3264/g.10175 Transcript_3264/m.10175 type:complete len:242 (-) Transcript_3264:383-1108(-)
MARAARLFGGDRSLSLRVACLGKRTTFTLPARPARPADAGDRAARASARDSRVVGLPQAAGRSAPVVAAPAPRRPATCRRDLPAWLRGPQLLLAVQHSARIRGAHGLRRAARRPAGPRPLGRPARARAGLDDAPYCDRALVRHRVCSGAPRARAVGRPRRRWRGGAAAAVCVRLVDGRRDRRLARDASPGLLLRTDADRAHGPPGRRPPPAAARCRGAAPSRGRARALRPRAHTALRPHTP